MKTIKHIFPEMLKTLRQKECMTQGQLASLVGKCRSSISVWETGRKTPEFEPLLKLTKVFGCSLDKLVFGGK